MAQEETQDKHEVIEEQLDFSRPDYKFLPKEVHDWKQRGYYLVCKSCDLEHGIFIGHDRLLVGIDGEGKPILKTRKELGMS